MPTTPTGDTQDAAAHPPHSAGAAGPGRVPNSPPERGFRYQRIFLYSSLQFSGHIEEYFAAHTEELLVFIWMPRFKGVDNLLRVYSHGRLISERKIRFPTNRILWYSCWFVWHWRLLLRCFPPRQPFVFFGWNPLCFLGIRALGMLREIQVAYWIGDYFEPTTLMQRAFNRLLARYHRKADYAFYLSDAINRRLNNGQAVDSPAHRTVMWGVKPLDRPHAPPPRPFTLLFVGMINPTQGLPNLFPFLRSRPDYRMVVVGLCPSPLYAAYQQLIKDSGVSDRVVFPNRFFSDAELRDVARSCHVGMALYETAPHVHTHYADPGKVKSYLEMGLPIVMTNISGVVPFVRRFGCGEVIDRLDHLGDAIDRIRGNYSHYLEGVTKMVQHFEFTRYYRGAFACWETNREGQTESQRGTE